MTLKITERDKKLLIVLAIVLLVGGVGIGILMPLVEKTQELSVQITDAEIEKQEKELKVVTLPTLQKREEAALTELQELKNEFYDIMRSVEIDRLMTGMAVSSGAEVKDMDIVMPKEDAYAQLVNYADMLSGDKSENTGDNDDTVFSGVYKAQVKMNMMGSRENMQRMLDACIRQEPKMRVASFSWQKNSREGSSEYTLNMTVEIYMCQDVQEYTVERLAQEEAEAAENAEESSGTEE